MEEVRVYLVNVDDYEFNTSPTEWTDDRFIAEAEIQGSVHTLEGFQKAFNRGEINIEVNFIRFK